MTEQLHVLPVGLISKRESLLDRVELNEACYDCSVLFHCLPHGLGLLHNLAHIFSHFEHSHIQTRMLFLVFVKESFKVLVHRMKESVDLLKTCLRESFNRIDSIINHRSKLLSLILILL